MANFLAILDPDPARRSRFIQTVMPLIPPVAGLVTQGYGMGNLQVIWAAHMSAPVTWEVDAVGAAVIWGEAIAEGSATRVNANQIRQLWNGTEPQTCPAFDGFYAAIAYRPQTGLIVGADRMGLFPVYYWKHADVVLVASSPELFRYHPLFHPQFNPAGLVGILLTNGLFAGQTLWQGILRLGAGHLLVCQPATAPQEIIQVQLSADAQIDQHKALSFAEQLELLNETIEQSLARHAPAKQHYALMLSGGLDSRMLAGYLARQGAEVIALTLGASTDIEMHCARRVARQLRFQHRAIAIPLQQYPDYMHLVTQWEHLANGYNWGMNWGIHPYLQDSAPRVITGYSLDAVVGGPLPMPQHSKDRSPFDLFFARGINKWGIQPEILKRLCRHEIFGDLVFDIYQQIQTCYESYAEDDLRRVWFFELQHQQRFHIGSAAWKLSFGAWPVLLSLDRQLMATTMALPIQTLRDRHAQKQLLCTQFPTLAQLPLDRNGFNTKPLLPTKSNVRLAQHLLQSKWQRLLQKMGRDRRYYYRICDFNNPGWQSIRRQANQHQKTIEAFFDPAVLKQILPSPDQRVRFKEDSITEASGLKALIGFILWSKEHL
ncbi:MAG: asparagine synthase-related protein [Oculatellaceae cyanobacterium bins.114]|nr:asparagine synthase-related protein [Oculatellaceae cyanobacterium bins.114]